MGACSVLSSPQPVWLFPSEMLCFDSVVSPPRYAAVGLIGASALDCFSSSLAALTLELIHTQVKDLGVRHD